MTQQEFTQRTNVEVSYNEFEAIHEVYMNSDLDKDNRDYRCKERNRKEEYLRLAK